MAKGPHRINRRSFLKVAGITGGGFLLSFALPANTTASAKQSNAFAGEPVTLNGYIQINADGTIIIMSPNPEGGQNVKTSMPMIVAEELDADWEKVEVIQAPLNTDLYSRQYIGGSRAISSSWDSLRTAGGTARMMILEAAAASWEIPVAELTTAKGMVHHKASGKSGHYGEFAATAASLQVPEKLSFKNKKDYSIIGRSKGNVDIGKIVRGEPLFGMDSRKEGMLYAMIEHPPAFGMQLKTANYEELKSLPGIRDAFPLKVYKEDFVRGYFDTCSFNEIVAIVAESTWDLIKAKNAIKAEWAPFGEHVVLTSDLRGNKSEERIPAGLESTAGHKTSMLQGEKQATTLRKDGDPEKAFASATKIIERVYTAPFLTHCCMEPINFFAHVTEEKAELAGPLQKAELTEAALSARLGMPKEKIDIRLTRLGGGFGRKSYAHYMIEAALISQRVKAPVKLIYKREDDMTSGIYRPMYRATYRAAINEKNELTAFHVNAGGIPVGPLEPDLFPASGIENFLAEGWSVESNITQGSFRAPRYNFLAAAEQSFLDEVAEAMQIDPFDLRLNILQRAAENPVGKKPSYDPTRYAAVLKKLREKSGWNKAADKSQHRGLAAYFCMNSYAAEVLDLRIENGQMQIPRVCCVVDAGIVINPDAATNLAEGCIVDGIGNALFGEMSFSKGKPDKRNFNSYRMIRHHEAPKSIDVHFIQSDQSPTGMGEPPFPPVFAALANALYKATGKRYYDQPFFPQLDLS